MAVELDDLVIKVESQANSATDSLDKLCQSLTRVKNATKGGLGLTSVTTKLQALDKAVSSLSGNGAARITQFADALSKLGQIGNVKLSSTIATQLTNIGAAVDVIDGVNFNVLTDLANGISSLGMVGNVKLSSTLATQINNIGTAMQSMNGVDFTGLNSMASGLQSLSNVGNIKISSSIATQLQNISNATQSMATADFSKLSELATALSGFAALPKLNINSFVKGIEKLAQADLATFKDQIQELTEAMQPFAEEMQSVADGFNSFPSRIQQLIRSENKLTTATTKSGEAFAFMAIKMQTVVQVVKRVVNVVAGWITKSNEYIEDLNLFNASMGEYASEAQAYAETVSEVMGIDTGEWMRNQGVFMTLATGFGVANDKAYKMSKNLTQLGYDIASFYNLSVEESMQKLESALAGELEPVRRIGYDLSKAALEGIIVDTDSYATTSENLANAMSDEAMASYAVSQGLTKNYSDMTQAEKSQLRYIALMNQVTVVQGDMARTLESPSNQLRILQAQIEMCARSLGNIFIPILNKVLPVIISIVKAIRWLATEIANFFGFTLPEVDYSGLSTNTTDDMDDVSDAIDDSTSSLGSAKDAAEEYKNALLGFDEINKLPDPTETYSSGTSGISSDIEDALSSLDFDLPEYDFLGSLETKIDGFYEKIVSIFEKIKSVIVGFIDETDFGPIKDAFSNLLDSFKHLGSSLMTYVQPIWEDILKPLAKWTIEKAAPAMVNLLANAFDFLAAVIEKLRPVFEWLWNNVLEPIYSFLGDVFLKVVNALSEEFQSLSERLKNSTSLRDFISQLTETEEAILSIATIVGSIVGVFAVINFAGKIKEIIALLGTGLGNAFAKFASVLTLGNLKITLITFAISALVVAGVWLWANWDEVCAALKKAWGSVSDYFTSVGEWIKEVFQAIGEKWQSVKDWFVECLDALKQKWEDFKDWISGIIENIKEFFQGLGDKWQEIKDSISDKIEEVKTKFTELKDKVKEAKTNIVSSVSGMWTSLSTKFNNIIDKLQEIYNWFGNVISKAAEWASSGWNTAKSKVTSVWNSIFGYASGGFPDEGEIFVSREAGPELVGTIGNRTAVANNDQIVAGISAGVYSAVVAAMGNTKSSGGSVTLSVNGKAFCRAIYNDMKAVTNEHGISLVNA